MKNDSVFTPMSLKLGAVGVDEAVATVFGRSKVVGKLWNEIRSGSLRVLAERRMGKTWVLMRALAECPDWAVAQWIDVEGCGSCVDFVCKLNETLHRRNLISENFLKSVHDWARRMAQRLQGQQVGDYSIPELESWTKLLDDTCRGLLDHSPGKVAVLMIDELPFFLDKLISNDHAEDAVQLLDRLRALRHEFPGLRMVFCGSLGLHIVLQRLGEKGYTGRPVNDMPPFEIPPLETADAQQLAGNLLLGEGIPSDALSEVARVVAAASDNVPFYIQHTVRAMRQEPQSPWTTERCESFPELLFDQTGDPAEFAYYDDRLDKYYPEDITDKARAVLSVLSRETHGYVFNDLMNLIRHRPKTLECDPDEVLRVLRDLRDDHYLVEKGERWRFKLDIVRRWWEIKRGRNTS